MSESYYNTQSHNYGELDGCEKDTKFKLAFNDLVSISLQLSHGFYYRNQDIINYLIRLNHQFNADW